MATAALRAYGALNATSPSRSNRSLAVAAAAGQSDARSQNRAGKAKCSVPVIAVARRNSTANSRTQFFNRSFVSLAPILEQKRAPTTMISVRNFALKNLVPLILNIVFNIALIAFEFKLLFNYLDILMKFRELGEEARSIFKVDKVICYFVVLIIAKYLFIYL